MNSVVFNVLEEFVVENASEQVLEKIFDVCQFITVQLFVGPGSIQNKT